MVERHFNVGKKDFISPYLTFKSRSRIFHLHRDVTIAGERWKAAKFWPMLGAQGLWAGSDLYRATPAVTRGLAKFWPMLGAQGLWAGKDIYRATPVVTRGLSFSGLIRKTAPFSRLLKHTRGCGGSILTRILTGLLISLHAFQTKHEFLPLKPRPSSLRLKI
jgi:hypothetical protein